MGTGDERRERDDDDDDDDDERRDDQVAEEDGECVRHERDVGDGLFKVAGDRFGKVRDGGVRETHAV